MFKEMTVDDFFDLLSSSSSTPGGGAASGISGAQGIALTSMVASLTVGKKKYSEYSELNEKAIEKAAHLKDEFLALADEDAESFDEMSRAYRMPNSSEEERKAREEALKKASKACAVPPFKMMEASYEALMLTKALVGKSNASAFTDLGAAALNLKASLMTAWLNVLINLKNAEDDEFARDTIKRGRELLEKCCCTADDIYNSILRSI